MIASDWAVPIIGLLVALVVPGIAAAGRLREHWSGKRFLVEITFFLSPAGQLDFIRRGKNGSARQVASFRVRSDQLDWFSVKASGELVREIASPIDYIPSEADLLMLVLDEHEREQHLLEAPDEDRLLTLDVYEVEEALRAYDANLYKTITDLRADLALANSKVALLEKSLAESTDLCEAYRIGAEAVGRILGARADERYLIDTARRVMKKNAEVAREAREVLRGCRPHLVMASSLTSGREFKETVRALLTRLDAVLDGLPAASDGPCTGCSGDPETWCASCRGRYRDARAPATPGDGTTRTGGDNG